MVNPASVSNFDVSGLADRICVFASEILNSQSSRTAEFNLHDRSRAEAYLQTIDDFVDLVTEDDNPLDLPKSDPGNFPLKAFPSDDVINTTENQSVLDTVRRFKSLWIEVVNSQSADRASGMQVQDKARCTALTANTRKLIKFGASASDTPESADNDVPTSPG